MPKGCSRERRLGDGWQAATLSDNLRAAAALPAIRVMARHVSSHRTVPTLHLISGLPASGKTTYAMELRQQVSGVLFCLDRWLITTFGRYSLPAVGQDEHTRRVLACRELIWESASELLQRSVDVILDDGFFYREHRMRHVALAAGIGASTAIHFVDTPLEQVRARLERRNADLPRFNFHIDPATLEGFLAMIERPTPEEGARVVIIRPESPAETR